MENIDVFYSLHIRYLYTKVVRIRCNDSIISYLYLNLLLYIKYIYTNFFISSINIKFYGLLN